MTDLDRVSRSLARVRGELSPSSADKVRLRARILAPPAPPIAHIEAPAPARLTRWAAVRMSGGLGLSLGALLVGAGVALGFWWGNFSRGDELGSHAPVERSIALAGAPLPAADERSVAARAVDGERLVRGDEGEGVRGAQGAADSANAPPAADPTTAPAVAPAADPTQSETSARPRAPAPDESAVHRHAKRTAAREAADDRLARELALLRRVERAIRANDPSLALALLEELDVTFPDTRLAEERLAARRIAECRAGHPDAIQSARRFILEHGSSVYRQRIGLACELGKVEQGTVEHEKLR